MPPRTGLKRAAGSNGEPSSSQSKHTSKKTRFVDPSDDPTKFAEDVDNALEDPLARRKGQVKTEGYDSDSSDDGEGVVLSRRKGGEKEGEDEDDDMFAMGEEEKEEAAGGKKKEEYLRLGDIEGQEFGNKSGSDGETSEDDDDPEDEDDAERKKKAGMGFELSSFNMREEMEEGKFASDGTYVRSFDPHGVHDKWMEGVDEKEMKMARRRKRHQERLQREKIKAEEKELAESGGKGALEIELVEMMKKGETVLEALQRLGAQAKKRSGGKRPPKGKSKAEANGASMDIDKQTEPISHIDQITHLASSIMSLGETDIYSKTYEELVRSIRSSGRVDPSWIPPSADPKYEYKWDVPGAGSQADEAFGPFGEDEMKSWFKAAYFGSTGEKVKVRQVGGEWGDWDNVII